jgi:hypothetical protein
MHVDAKYSQLFMARRSPGDVGVRSAAVFQLALLGGLHTVSRRFSSRCRRRDREAQAGLAGYRASEAMQSEAKSKPLALQN